MEVAVLGGAGLIGRGVVLDLTNSKNVDRILMGDINLDLAKEISNNIGSNKIFVEKVDARNPESVAKVIKNSDVVVNCVQYYFNLNVMKACLKVGVPYLDLGGLFHMTKKQLELDKEFKDASLIAILGMGACPGVSNVQARHCAEILDTIDYIHIYSATSKKKPSLSWDYSILTILDEMTKKPVVFRGEFREFEPFSEYEVYNFMAPIGYRKVHHSLHSEIATLPLSYRDKGVKEVFFKISFFGYTEEDIEKLRLLTDLGFADTEEILVGDKKVRPRDVLIKVLQKHVRDVEEEIEESIVTEAKGKKNGEEIVVRVDTTTKNCPIYGATGLTSVPPSIVSQWVLKKKIKETGVLPPENCIAPKPFFEELKLRNIKTYFTVRNSI